MTTDHFRTIGFTLERPEFEQFLRRAFAEGTHITAPHGDYHVWRPGDGSELWVATYRLGKRRELAGAHPHFEAGARMSVVVESLDRDPEFPLEGELYAWATPPGSTDDGEHGLYPFSASVADFDAIDERRDVPFRATLSLAGFASDLQNWPDEASFHAADHDDLNRSIQSFIPVGLFGQNTGVARSQAIVTGIALSAETVNNAATGRPYYRLRLATYGGELELIAAPDLAVTLPIEGSIVEARCWLTARILP